ncbi:hypothetical protein D3C85_1097920 [compost metagenome]
MLGKSHMHSRTPYRRNRLPLLQRVSSHPQSTHLFLRLCLKKHIHPLLLPPLRHEPSRFGRFVFSHHVRRQRHAHPPAIRAPGYDREFVRLLLELIYASVSCIQALANRAYRDRRYHPSEMDIPRSPAYSYSHRSDRALGSSKVFPPACLLTNNGLLSLPLEASRLA